MWKLNGIHKTILHKHSRVFLVAASYLWWNTAHIDPCYTIANTLCLKERQTSLAITLTQTIFDNFWETCNWKSKQSKHECFIFPPQLTTFMNYVLNIVSFHLYTACCFDNRHIALKWHQTSPKVSPKGFHQEELNGEPSLTAIRAKYVTI